MKPKMTNTITLHRYASRQFDIQVQFFPSEIDTGERHKYTVLIGPNGTGKSRVLADVCATFFEKSHSIKAIERFGFSPDGTVNLTTGKRLWTLVKEIRGSKNEEDIQRPKHPGKIIAATATPFDKFPRPSINTYFHRWDYEEESGYIYAGLNDFRRPGPPTLRSPVQAFAEAVVISHVNGSRRNFDMVLKRMGFDTNIEIEFFRDLFTYEDFIKQQHSDTEYSNKFARRRELHLLSRLGEIRVKRMFDLMSHLHGATSSEVRTRRLRIRTPIAELLDAFDAESALLFSDLIQYGLLRPTNVMLSKGGRQFEYNRISSGELSLLTVFSSIACHITDGSLVFIDEPELSLHPERQLEYISLLEDTFSSVHGCHFVLASHSPLILASLPEGRSHVTSINRDHPLVIGESSDYFLAEAFNVPGPKNRYVLQETYRAMSLASKGDIQRMSEVLTRLEPHFHRMKESESTKELLKSLYNLKKERGVN